ncbi:MAG: sigma-54 interaction domain-containing protein [Candidatus Phaeomarinobacter sp.]
MPVSPAEDILPTEGLMDILNALSDGVWVCDATPRLLWINRACEELNDIQAEDVCGRLVQDLLDQGNFDADVTRQVLSSGAPVTINQRVKSNRMLLVSGLPVFDESGEVAYVVGNERDVTELDLLRSQLDSERARAERVNKELAAMRRRISDVSDIVCASEEMELVLDTAITAAGFDTTVFVTGPTGSGKSMVARFIHDASNRQPKPFLTLNAAAIPETLLEAELFGFADGAFTGARKGGKPGLIEAADGGTLFLDEIDALPPSLQVKLLTFLDTQRYFRVGDTKERQADVRIIVASNADIPARIGEGAFREDLWFRLNVLTIAVPPLDERPDDIAPLIARTLEELESRYGRERRMSPAALDLLTRFRYPGNVRQLQNIVERAYVLCRSDDIGPDDLPADVRAAVPQRVHASAGGGSTLRLADALRVAERGVIEDAAARCATQTEIAKTLGVSQPTVARLLKKHGLGLSR